MNSTREASVAGIFYPREKEELQLELSGISKKVEIKSKKENILGIVVPHAGINYSGECAMYGYKAISKKKFKTAVIIAPSHKFGGFDFSVGNFDEYRTPLGTVPVNKEYVRQLLRYDSVSFSPKIHNVEHSLEVQLPFLQFLDKNIDIVPILLGSQTLGNSILLADIILEIFGNKLDDVIFIISSDLSHYHELKIARELDDSLMNSLAHLDIDKLAKSHDNHRVEACGIGGILTLMNLAKKLNYRKVDNLKYCHSGEVTSESNLVVGYLASVVYK